MSSLTVDLKNPVKLLRVQHHHVELIVPAMQNRLVELHRFLHAHESSPLDSGIAFHGMYFRLAEETALVTRKLSYAETIVFWALSGETVRQHMRVNFLIDPLSLK
jgi:hypothetical protein